MSPEERALAAPRDRRTVVPLGDAGVGGGRFAVFAGPTRATGPDASLEIGRAFAGAGVALLHNGTTSQDDPHDRPSRTEISILSTLREQTGLPVAAPITDIADVEAVGDSVDVVQLAGYHMQNYRLLKELGQLNRPVILRRGTANTVDELVSAAEYVLVEGNPNVILCEHGIRTFERLYELTLDFAAVPLLKERTASADRRRPLGGGPPEPRRAPRAGRRGGGRGRDHPRGESRRPGRVPGHRGAGDRRRRRAQPLASAVSADVQASPAQGQPAASEGRSDRKPPWMPILGRSCPSCRSPASSGGRSGRSRRRCRTRLRGGRRSRAPSRSTASRPACAASAGRRSCATTARIPKRADSYALTAVGYMGNNVLPARAGDAFRVVFMAPRADTGARTVIGTLVAERLLDIAVLGTAFVVLTFGVVDHAGLPSGRRLQFVPGGHRRGDRRRAAAVIVAHRRGHLARAVGVRRADDRGDGAPARAHGAEMLGTTVVIWALEASVWWATGEASGLGSSARWRPATCWRSLDVRDDPVRSRLRGHDGRRGDLRRRRPRPHPRPRCRTCCCCASCSSCRSRSSASCCSSCATGRRLRLRLAKCRRSTSPGVMSELAEAIWGAGPLGAVPEHFAPRRDWLLGHVAPGARVLDLGSGPASSPRRCAGGRGARGRDVARGPLRRAAERDPSLDLRLWGPASRCRPTTQPSTSRGRVRCSSTSSTSRHGCRRSAGRCGREGSCSVSTPHHGPGRLLALALSRGASRRTSSRAATTSASSRPRR